MENRKGAAGDREPESLFQRLGRQLRQVFLRQLALGLLFLAGVLLGGGHLPGALLGTASGLMDTALFLWGVHRGMGKPPAQAALSMHRMMFLRIAVLLGITVLALREKWQSVLVLAGFLVLNIGLIIQLAKSRPGCRKL